MRISELLKAEQLVHYRCPVMRLVFTWGGGIHETLQRELNTLCDSNSFCWEYLWILYTFWKSLLFTFTQGPAIKALTFMYEALVFCGQWIGGSFFGECGALRTSWLLRVLIIFYSPLLLHTDLRGQWSGRCHRKVLINFHLHSFQGKGRNALE